MSVTAHSPRCVALDCVGGFGTAVQRAEEDSGDTEVTGALVREHSAAPRLVKPPREPKKLFLRAPPGPVLPQPLISCAGLCTQKGSDPESLQCAEVCFESQLSLAETSTTKFGLMSPEDRTEDENVSLVTCLLPLRTDVPRFSCLVICGIPRTRALLAHTQLRQFQVGGSRLERKAGTI